MSTPNLTSTSFAILGFLSLRPWTTYELAEQMDRAVGQFWPRAKSKLYEEPKKLVASGLARSAQESTGKRKRTVYTITPAGRKALARWMKEPAAGPEIEFEAMLKVFFAEAGTKADLLATIAEVRASLVPRLEAAEGISAQYLEGEGRFQSRLPWLVLAGRFLADFEEMVLDWAEWAESVVATWPDDITKATPDVETLRGMAERGDRDLDRARRTKGER